MHVCMDCFEIYEEEYLSDKDYYDYPPCPKRNCDGRVVELDEYIAPSIILLNQKGYMTEYCCAGHWYDGHIDIYIKFFDEDCIPIELPDGFHLERSQHIVRYREEVLDNQPIAYKMARIAGINQQLIHWAENLEDNEEV